MRQSTAYDYPQVNLRRLKTPAILRNGKPILLSPEERWHAQYTQVEVNKRWGMALKNALGFEVPITTLTTIVKKVSMMKLYEIAPADYVPIKVGEGTWSSNLTTYRSFDIADEFESGIINTGGANTRASIGDAGVDSVNVKVNNWLKNCEWSIFDLQQAAKSGNWDIVTAKEKTRKRNWDLGIQRVAFLGARGQNTGSTATCLGLLNQPGITFNTSLITAELNTLTPAQLSTFQQTAIAAYRKNCNYTAFPTHFIVPESDYNGMAAQASSTYPMKTILDLLQDGFRVITRNKNFKILPLAYCDYANAGGSLPSNVTTAMYAFLNYDEESIRMDIPLDYTNTLANSLNNFMFQNAGYGQFTGVVAYRPLELYYAGY
jgi:hypothetical protein